MSVIHLMCSNGGQRLPLLFTSQLSPYGWAFLAEMAGQQTGLNGRENKLA